MAAAQGKSKETATPFVKWAGGKTRLLPRILPCFPDRLKTYFEPFVGGGAVFFAMAGARRFDRAVLADTNSELINLYLVVRDHCVDLVRSLEPHVVKAKDPEWFYHVRSLNPAEMEPVQRAARTLFLNRTCFNGLYRVNRRGEFNVPFGKYPNPKVLDVTRLEAASRALQGVRLCCTTFAEAVAEAGHGDGVYFDPPYVPISATSSFTAYQAEAFGARDQRLLVDVYQQCWERGATAVMSNSDCVYTRELYQWLKFEVVKVPRAINSVGRGRGCVNELLVVGPGNANQSSRATSTVSTVLRGVSS